MRDQLPVTMLEELHKKSIYHRKAMVNSTMAFCFHCLRSCRRDEIHKFIDMGWTALCPWCSIDALIPSLDMPANVQEDDVLQQMHDYWFNTNKHWGTR
jgi:hypothetical protein